MSESAPLGDLVARLRIGWELDGWLLVTTPDPPSAALEIADAATGMVDAEVWACEAAGPLDLDAAEKPSRGVWIVHGLDSWTEADLAVLDRLRSRLHHDGPTLLVVRPETASTFRAPHVTSWIRDVVSYAGDQSFLTESEREARVVAHREAFDMTDEQALAALRAGTAPPDPEFAEWIALLGRTDLLL